MSEQTDAVGDDEGSPSTSSNGGTTSRLLGAVVFMLWTRLRSYGNFIRDGEVYFRGNDAWYHFRETSYLLENWPSTLPFDVWTGFPVGRSAGQFGTLWDHIMAVSVWIARPIMGSTEEVMLIMAPIAGALVAVPTYLHRAPVRRSVRRARSGRGPRASSGDILQL